MCGRLADCSSHAQNNNGKDVGELHSDLEGNFKQNTQQDYRRKDRSSGE